MHTHLFWLCYQMFQWVEVCLRPDVVRVEFLDKLNAALQDSLFLSGPRATAVDFLAFFIVHPVVVRTVHAVACA